MSAAGAEGFRTRSRGDLAVVLLEMGRSIVVSVGPWLFTIAALLLVTKLALNFTTRDVLADFRALLIYAFALSLIATAPVAITLSRILADTVYGDARKEIATIFLPALPLAWALSAALALVVCWLAAASFEVQLALVHATGIIGMTWVALAACNALRDFVGIAVTFLVGLVISVAGSFLAAAYGFTADGMLVAFSGGLAVVFVALCARLLKGASVPDFALGASLRAFAASMADYRLIAFGALFGAVALWADKFVIWMGPAGEHVSSGIVHAPLYDSAAFLASLAIIPSLAHFIRILDTEYRSIYRGYYDAIGDHATLSDIEIRSAALKDKTLRLLDRILVNQIAISAIVVFLAPAIVGVVGLPYSGIPILRSCAIAAVFLLLFLATTSLLLFFDRHREFLCLQVLFAVLNTAGTAAVLFLGPDYQGLGFLGACVASGTAAYMVFLKIIDRLDYHTFVEGAVRQQRVALAASRQMSADGPAF
ncbi:exopolysaccharide Pel transporter PelG [Hyphomicrobium sp.]|uniref:exopolysaccharide Pel transporter PelG n=1 Tax=Hyphomicrobium sp. TaxID=82 RepID=UPI002FDD4416